NFIKDKLLHIFISHISFTLLSCTVAECGSCLERESQIQRKCEEKASVREKSGNNGPRPL
ncbi:hypothetical protein Y032_0994g3333, partial [Ancylostoma ceylanicum]